MVGARSSLENYKEVLAQAKRRDVQGLREHLRTAVVDHGIFVHGLAARKLAQLGSVESAPDIVPLLEDSAWQVRTDAARALSMLGHPGIADELIRRLDEPDDGVLCFIILALGRTRDPASVPALGRILSSSVSPVRADAVRARAAQALGETRHHTAVPDLGRALTDRSRAVRYCSVRGLAAMGLEQATQALAEHSRWRYPVTTARARLVARLGPSR